MGAFHKAGSIGVIIEYMDRGSLDFVIKKSIKLSEEMLAAIAYQVLWGLGYLHYDNKLHRDIKPANVLINSLGTFVCLYYHRILNFFICQLSAQILS